jgi:hypothetical protein
MNARRPAPARGGYASLVRRSDVVATVSLTHPIRVAGSEVDALGLTRPKLRDFRGLNVTPVLRSIADAIAAIPEEGGEEATALALLRHLTLPPDAADVVIALLARLAEIREDEAGEVDFADVGTCLEVLVGFFFDSPTTGSATP